jgi:hypothetical protein
MIRNEIENLIFRVKILHPLNDDFLKRFTDYNFYSEKDYDMKANKEFMTRILAYLESTNSISMR